MTFGAPLFLIAALAGLIPVVLHMINRQQAPVMHFSTLRFLQLSVQKTRRRKYIHDALLLALRVLALVLIAIALSQPAVFQLQRWLGAGGETAIVLILDNSASMSRRDQTGSRWERLQQAATAVLDAAGPQDQLALLTTNGKPPLADRKLYRDQEIIRRALDRVKPSFERAELPARVSEARQLLARAQALHQEIYLVTDMQAASWKSKLAPPPPKLASVPMVIVDVSGPALTNVALSDLAVQAPAPAAGVPLKVSVEVAGDAKIETQRHVALTIGQQRKNSPTLRMPPGQAQRHTFVTVPRQAGMYAGTVTLDEPDSCPADDRLFFAANTSPAVPVAVVTQTSGGNAPTLDAAFYLRSALAPGADPKAAIRLSSLAAADLPTETLSAYAVIFCVDLEAPSPSVATRLLEYTRAGGHLVWIAGDHVDPIQYSALNDRLGGELLPVHLTRVRGMDAEHPDGWHIAWLDPAHPVTGVLAEPASLFQTVLVRRFIEVPPPSGTGARVLARLDDGHPMLVEKTVGAGRVLFWNSSFHIQWTNLPLRPIFLPLIARLVFELAGAEASQPLLVAGRPWTIPAVVDPQTEIEVTRPDGAKVRLAGAQRSGEPTRLTDTYQVGVYQVKVTRSGRTQQYGLAVNPDPDEIAAGRVAAEELVSRCAPTPLRFCRDPAQVAETISKLRSGHSLWGWFLLLVLVALVAESFVANRRTARIETAAAGRHASAGGGGGGVTA